MVIYLNNKEINLVKGGIFGYTSLGVGTIVLGFGAATWGIGYQIGAEIVKKSGLALISASLPLAIAFLGAEMIFPGLPNSRTSGRQTTPTLSVIGL